MWWMMWRAPTDYVVDGNHTVDDVASAGVLRGG